MLRQARAAALSGMAYLGLASGALADAIDGDWCFADGRHFSIRGQRITTPAGTTTEGDYSRHAFRYVIPDADPGAGTTVTMQLLDELTVRLQPRADAAPELWQRCELEVSMAVAPATAAPLKGD